MEVKKMFLFSQQIDVEAEYKKREQTNKAQINLVVIGKIMATSSCIWYHFVLNFIWTHTVHSLWFWFTMKSCEKVIMNSTGHVDAGKSTLMGHLLYLLGNVSKKAMHR